MTTSRPTLIFPIVKREKFDEDNIKHLLNDDRFSKTDRGHLSTYNKHRVSGSNINVSYKLGAGCEEHQLGRLFPEDCVGLQSFRFDIRNPLSSKWYWDTDIENCHYIIANRCCELLGINNEKIQYYINNREECLKLVSSNRKKANTEFLKTLYLGNIKLYNEGFNDVVDGAITEDGIKFIYEINKEVETLAIMMWEKFPQYHKIKNGKDKKLLCKKPNSKASLMSLIFQTEERNLLLAWKSYLTENERYLAVYIHDGGYVEKMEGETEFPKHLLEERSQYVEEQLGYKVTLTQKDIKYDWTPYKPQ